MFFIIKITKSFLFRSTTRSNNRCEDSLRKPHYCYLCRVFPGVVIKTYHQHYMVFWLNSLWKVTLLWKVEMCLLLKCLRTKSKGFLFKSFNVHAWQRKDLFLFLKTRALMANIASCWVVLFAKFVKEKYLSIS